jgi:hypothetical protein
MFSLAIRAGGVLLVLIGLCAAALLLLARLQPPSLTDFTADCAGQVGRCWRGITPGLTSVREAEGILQANGYSKQMKGVTGVELQDRVLPYRLEGASPACVDVYFGYQIVGVRTVILFCLGLRVGDVLLALGEPELRVSYGTLGEDWLYERLTVRLVESLNDPFAPVDHIRLVLDRTPYARKGATWYGLLPLWKFCQLEPAYPDC